MGKEANPGFLTMLESNFPSRAVSHVIQADKRAIDATYSAHRWWARRPPALLRAALLAATLPASTTRTEFWQRYSAGDTPLRGLRVHDPFMGGGTTLVEAARLGADVSGTDIDPIAVEVTRYALRPVPAEDVRLAGDRLIAFLTEAFGSLYPSSADQEALHYFWVHVVTCPECGRQGPLYKNLVLARDDGKPGAVVRDEPLTVYDPVRFDVHYLSNPHRKVLAHEGRRYRLDQGSYHGFRYHCECGKRSSHRELQTGRAPRRLIAVEMTSRSSRRRIVAPNRVDHLALEDASSLLENPPVAIHRPLHQFSTDRQDERPLSYGLYAVDDLFTDRQRLVLGAAKAWIESTDLEPEVESALELALSNALATNNRLCGYAVDYGRLSPLFSIRGYSLPALATELNPIHPNAGRGTLRRCIERVARSAGTSVRRHRWDPVTGRPRAFLLEASPAGVEHDIEQGSAAALSSDQQIDICLFDPPYFDYIHYEELSELYRGWRGGLSLNGKELHPTAPDAALEFGLDLAACLGPVLERLVEGRPLSFTYHSTSPAAWDAIGFALDETKLAVTALWPIRSDGHMGHHSNEGNCEWDLLVVCRPALRVTPLKWTSTVDHWVESMKPFQVSEADRRNMSLAIQMAEGRFAGVQNSEGT